MDRQYFEECKKQKSEKDIFVPTTKSEKPDLRVCILSSFRKVFFTSSDGADCSVIYIILKPFSSLFDKYKNIYQLTNFFLDFEKNFLSFLILNTLYKSTKCVTAKPNCVFCEL